MPKPRGPRPGWSAASSRRASRASGWLRDWIHIVPQWLDRRGALMLGSRCAARRPRGRKEPLMDQLTPKGRPRVRGRRVIPLAAVLLALTAVLPVASASPSEASPSPSPSPGRACHRKAWIRRLHLHRASSRRLSAASLASCLRLGSSTGPSSPSPASSRRHPRGRRSPSLWRGQMSGRPRRAPMGGSAPTSGRSVVERWSHAWSPTVRLARRASWS